MTLYFKKLNMGINEEVMEYLRLKEILHNSRECYYIKHSEWRYGYDIIEINVYTKSKKMIRCLEANEFRKEIWSVRKPKYIPENYVPV